MEISQHIEINPKMLMGKPVLKGARISAEMILEKLSAGEQRMIYFRPPSYYEDIKAAFGLQRNH